MIFILVVATRHITQYILTTTFICIHMNTLQSNYYRLKTELQEKILEHVCKTKNADYKTISKATDRDRITILQSLQPLMKGHYVSKEKVVPENEKSKLIFKPTQKGMIYSIAFLNVGVDDVLESYQDICQITNYTEFIKSISDDQLRNHLVKDYAKLIAEQNAFDDRGDIIKYFEGDRYTKDDVFRDDILQQSISKGAFSQNIDSLKMVYNMPEQVVRLQNYLTEQSKSLDSTIIQLQLTINRQLPPPIGRLRKQQL
jgi:predicted transcriptional regulator